MTTTDQEPKRYSIDALLNNGVQPFDDLDGEALDAIGKGIGRKELAVPVVITSDGVLVDGHQRLRAIRARGRKTIDAHDVRVLDHVDADGALEWAVKLNVQRRHLTTEQKADVARRLQKERRWTQRKIADLFGVSQPAVSQWLRDDDDKPTEVIGKDGVAQRVLSKRPPRPKPTPDPWDIYNGPMFKAIEQLTARLRDQNNWPNRQRLTEQEWDVAIDRLNHLEALIGEILAKAPEEEEA